MINCQTVLRVGEFETVANDEQGELLTVMEE
jgi:hypothetical protein